MRPVAGQAILIAVPRNRIPREGRVALLRVADLEIDALHRRVRQGTRELRITPDEHILLYTLAARAGVLISYRELADALGSTDTAVRNNTVARHLSGLRQKLRDDPKQPRYIETVPGIGLRFKAGGAA
jgi:DNA-binding response OmpR family regulator